MEHEKLLALLEGVRRMRTLQRAWFGGDKSAATLAAARAAEREVDRLVKAVDDEIRQPSLPGSP